MTISGKCGPFIAKYMFEQLKYNILNQFSVSKMCWFYEVVDPVISDMLVVCDMFSGGHVGIPLFKM